MTTYLIEPRDTLVLGDGRGIGQSTATRSLDMPWPSSMAGMLRTEAGRDAKTGVFKSSLAETSKSWKSRGPFLAELGESGEPSSWLAPAPRDAVFIGSEALGVVRRQLKPLPSSSGATDLPSELQLVGMQGEPELRKSWSRTPRFWRWTDFERWLVEPADHTKVDLSFGREGPAHERRHHISLSPDTRTVREHVLFEVEHVNFRKQLDRGLAFAATFDGPELGSRTVGLGGERRLSFMKPIKLALPTPSRAMVDSVAKTRRARLVLLTPAIFDQGFRPSTIKGATLTAVAVDRPMVVSGWDWAANTPKAARRCAPPGSVLWVQLDEGVDAAAWVQEHWLEALSSDEQDCRDGFGLTAVGVGT